MSNGRTASLFGGDAPRATGPALPDAADDARHDTPQADAGAAASLARDVPLAERLRPRTLDDVVGQAHLLGPGKPLRVAWERHHLHSMILWGPPGVGKTTLARLMAGVAGAQFISLSAVLSGVKDIREAVEQAREARAAGRSTVVFVDEVHRFNKAQQDAFLPHVESGLFTFIGATTENPSFEVNSALLSRATVHVLKPLETADLMTLLARAQAALDSPPLSAEAGKRLVAHCDGDARRLLNDLDNVVAALPVLPHGPGVPGVASPEPIDEQTLERLLGEQLRRYDKGGDHFYDTISALHKAVRGSDPDAALYWLARMLDGGADPRYVARRMLRMASEDIGLADPRALQLALQAAEVYDRMGSPEGELALAQALVYLAVAPKSNAVYVAWSQARDFVRRDGTRPVPERLRNAPTRLMKDLGFGRGYRYAHDEQDAFAAGERYFPDDVDDQRFYQPPPRGLEARIAQRLAELRAANAQAAAAPDSRAAARDSTDGAQKADP